MSKSTVYFTSSLTPDAVVSLYRRLGIDLPGRVAVKVHSGEEGNQNYLHPSFLKPMVDAVSGTVVECNTAYGGARNTTSTGSCSKPTAGPRSSRSIFWTPRVRTRCCR